MSRSRSGLLALTGTIERSRPSIDRLSFSFSLTRTRHDGPDDQSGVGGSPAHDAAHAARPGGVPPRRVHADLFTESNNALRRSLLDAAKRRTHHVPRHEWYHTEALRASVPRPPPSTAVRTTTRRHMATDPAHAASFHKPPNDNKEPSNPVVNIPNALSMARLLSGPAIGHLILADNLSLAIPCLIISALTDWLDGYAARKTKTVNVLGSYLDPLADKVLVGSVAVSMGCAGLLDPWLFGLIIGRDACIVVGSFGLRWRRFGYDWPAGGWKEFFNVSLETEEQGTAEDLASGANAGRNKTEGPTKETLGTPMEATEPTAGSSGGGRVYTATRPAEPLYISKVNTVAQLTLISATLTNAWINFPSHDIITAVLAPVTAVTTVTSGLAYVDAYRQGKLRI